LKQVNKAGKAETKFRIHHPGLKSLRCKTVILFTLLVILAAFVPDFIITSVTAAQPDKSINALHAARQKVLVLHSYHNMDWTRTVQEGIESVFDKSGMAVEMYVEYMNTMRHPPKDSFAYLEDLYRKKYAHISFEVILLSDNNALDFILPRRDRLFPEVPIVFCGINDFREEQLYGQSGITGVNEDIDIRGTIELASRIMPNISKFLAISDRTPTGLANRRKFEQTVSGYSDQAPAFELLDDLTTTDLQKHLGRLSHDSVVLLLTFQRDTDGRLFTPPEYYRLIVESCDVPVFTFWEQEALLHGVMGGVMVSGVTQGEKSAEYALRILKGEPASSLPFIMKSPNVPILSYPILRQFNISKEVLPAEVILRNEPTTFYYRHKAMIWLISCFFIAIAFVNMILWMNIARRKRAEEELRLSEENFRFSLEDSPMGVRIVTEGGEFLYANRAILDIYGCDSFEELKTTPVEKRYTPESFAEHQIRKEKRKRGENVPSEYDISIVRTDGEIRHLQVFRKEILWDGERQYQVIYHDSTDRKRVEAKLKETYDIIGRSLVVAFLWKNAEGWPVGFVTDNVEVLFGYKAEEFTTGKVPYSKTVHPDDLERVAKEVADYSKDKGILAFDHKPYRIITKDGKTKWVNDSTFIRRNEKGGIAHYQGILFDITEQKKTEAALRESETRYRTLIETSQDLIYTIDSKGVLTYVNPTLERVMGYKKSELNGQSVSRIAAPEFMDIMRDYFRMAMKGESISVYEVDLIRKDGTEVSVEFNVTTLFDPDGNPSGRFGIGRDITERKKAEKERREYELRLASIIDFQPDAMLAIDRDGKVIAWNRAIEDMTGVKSEEILGKGNYEHALPFYGKRRPILLDFVFFWDQEIEKQYSFIKKEGDALYTETEVPFVRGESRILWGKASPLYDIGGNIVGAIESIRDVTERKQAEERLEEAIESLRKAFGTIIQVMVSAVEVRDPYTAGHQFRSADIARSIATEMGLSQEKIEGIRIAGSIHDIGKLAIPAEILSKPTKLSALEFSLIKEHARRGYEMLKDVESPWPLAEIVCQHHERMNGSGYPRNLKGDDILLEARIMAVADVVEAMTAHRPYRPALGIDAALKEIENNRGLLYDSDVVDACLRLFKEKKYADSIMFSGLKTAL